MCRRPAVIITIEYIMRIALLNARPRLAHPPANPPIRNKVWNKTKLTETIFFFLYFFPPPSQVNETFKIDIKQLHERFKDSILTWVQQAKYMPKELDVSLDETYLVGLTFKDVLHAVYVGLQNLAVGLEQVTWDQKREELPFFNDFKETTFKLRAVSGFFSFFRL